MPTILYVSFSTELYGSERCLLELIQGLSRKGYHAILVAPRPGPLTEQLEALNVPVIFVPLIKRWLPHPSAASLKRLFYSPYQFPFLLRSAAILREVIRRHHIDLVHTQSSVVFDGALAAAWAKVAHVWHIHETLGPGTNWRFFLGDKAAKRLISHFSGRIIATSEAIRHSYLDVGCEAGKIKTIYNGVELNRSGDMPGPILRQRLGIPTTAKLVGMVANTVPLKRYEDFLRAAVIVRRTIPDSFFLAVGGDWDTSEYGRAIKEFSSELGLAEQIMWLGFCDKIQEILGAIDLLVLPSEEESTPRVIIEAMAAHKPVVATRVGGIPEIVVDEVTGLLVPPKSPAELAQAIIRVLQDPVLAHAMGQAGYHRAEKYFSVGQYIENVEKTYWELLKSDA